MANDDEKKKKVDESAAKAFEKSLARNTGEDQYDKKPDSASMTLLDRVKRAADLLIDKKKPKDGEKK